MFKSVNYQHQVTILKSPLTMDDQDSEVHTAPGEENQWVLVVVDAEVRESSVVSHQNEMAQGFVVLLRDELHNTIGHQRAVAIQMDPLQGHTGLQHTQKVLAAHIHCHDVDAQVGAATDQGFPIILSGGTIQRLDVQSSAVEQEGEAVEGHSVTAGEETAHV